MRYILLLELRKVTVGIKEGDNIKYLYKGSIIQYGEKVHIKSAEGGFDCWLYRAE